MTVDVECRNGQSFCGSCYDFHKLYGSARKTLEPRRASPSGRHIELDGSELFRPKAETNVEGIVAKRDRYRLNTQRGLRFAIIGLAKPSAARSITV